MSPFELWSRASPQQATADLLACCGSRRWAETLVARRPFTSASELFAQAESRWFSIDEPDWLEAFACHPRIGENKASTNEYLASSQREQAEAQQTLASVAKQLVAGNRLYEERFGFRYIVFASGRSAPELLRVLEQRLSHTRAQELIEAARQQHRITTLRIERWLQPQQETP